MSNQDKLSQNSLSTLFSRNAIEDLGIKNCLKIDERLLVDVNRLCIGQIISEGRGSTVYQGLYRSTPVAVKILRPGTSAIGSPDVQRNFIWEVSTLSGVNHKNIVKIIGVVLEPKMMILTELMKGGTLHKLLWSFRPNCLDMNISMHFALEISQAMEYLHQNGIIHRDLKPSNLLLTEDRRKIIIADFGLAREVSDDEMTTEAGTYRWMAPEMLGVDPTCLGAIRKMHYNHKVDVYSFSMVLYELLTNRTPFDDRTSILAAYAASMNKRPSLDNIPEQLAPLLQSCWAENPDERPEFHQITELLQDFIGSNCEWTNESEEAEPSLLMRSEENEDSLNKDFMKYKPKRRSKGLLRRCFGRFGNCVCFTKKEPTIDI